MTANEKLVKRLEENNLALKASVSIDHPNKQTAEWLMLSVQLSGVKLNPVIEVIEKTVEVVEPKEVLPEKE